MFSQLQESKQSIAFTVQRAVWNEQNSCLIVGEWIPLLFVEGKKIISVSSGIAQIVRICNYFFPLQIRSKVMVLRTMCTTVYLSIWHWMKPQQMHERSLKKKLSQSEKLPNTPLPLLPNYIYLGRGSEENVCVFKREMWEIENNLMLVI